MNEEEKQAIKELQNKHIFFSEYEAIEDYETENNINTILNLIEKQQKEIENYQILKDDIEGHRIVYVDTPEFEENYISKDKIKEKIEELKQYKEEIKEEKDTEYYTTLRIIKALRKLLVSGQESDQEGGQENE